MTERVPIYSKKRFIPPSRKNHVVSEVHRLILIVDNHSFNDGKAWIHPRTFEQLGLVHDDIIKIEDVVTGNHGFCFATSSDEINEDVISLDLPTMETIGVTSGFDVNVSCYDGPLVHVDVLKLSIDSFGGDLQSDTQLLDHVNSQQTELELLLNQRAIYPGLQIRLGGVLYTVLENERLRIGSVARFSLNEFAGFTYVFSGGILKFNAILIIDTSASMKTQDVLVKECETVVDLLSNLDDSEEFQEFLSHFTEGTHVKRSEAAALAVLLFLFEKVGRGYGEKIVVLPFSDSPHPVEFNIIPNAPHVLDFERAKSSDIVMRIVNAILDARQATRLRSALDFARFHVLVEELSLDDPTMFFILTDGNPNSPQAVRSIVAKDIAPLSNVVIYSIGLGNPTEVNSELLMQICYMGKGEYHYATDMKDLLSWYSNLARKFTLNIGKSL